MKIKTYPIVISLGIMVFLFNISESLAVDEWSNKIEMKTSVNLPESEQKVEVVVSQEEIYDFNTDDWAASKYALELGTDLTRSIGFAVEYKYTDNKNNIDGEDIEGNLSFCYDFPLKIELKDENKLTTDIRKGDYAYENEIELSKEIAKFSEDRVLTLLVGDVVVYDFQEDKWTENEVNLGIEMVFSRFWKLEIKYCYIDILDNPDDSQKIKTKLTFNF